MRHAPIPPSLFVENRERLKKYLLPHSLVVVQANDILPGNADGTIPLLPNSDLFYLTGIEQEETMLLIAPDATNKNYREILFVRETNDHIQVWEGQKHSRKEASDISGVQQIKWLSEFPTVFRQLMCEVEHVYLNSNEHPRATIEVETRDARFVKRVISDYPLHNYHRLARIMHDLRPVKSTWEIDLIKKACAITRDGFLRVLKKTKHGHYEFELEAEFAHEFIRNRARFAYTPIIAAGANSCVLHYMDNNRKLHKGDVLLLDVGASYANYAADMTRTIPVSGKFSKRQKQVYNAVLRVLKAMIKASVPGKIHHDWQKESHELMTNELLELGLIKKSEVKKQDPDQPACRKYFMHGLGHPLGLDVHDVAPQGKPFQPGWVLTVEPGIYIPEEGFGVRLENDILVTEKEPIDLMADIPIEIDEIESLMK